MFTGGWLGVFFDLVLAFLGVYLIHRLRWSDEDLPAVMLAKQQYLNEQATKLKQQQQQQQQQQVQTKDAPLDSSQQELEGEESDTATVTSAE
ncbi:hypothetical protein GQ42DRAFT_164870 [Ramicandelaber brevisporus]|nr:hypothetical protein GQ42DRAFT_164870 [Ramicandelaber brevisporus]